MPPLELDLRLNRSFFQNRVHPSAGIEASEETLSEHELVSIQVARQSDALVTALVAIDLRAAEGRPFGTLPAEAQVQMRTREYYLIRRHRGITADQDAHRVHATPACEILFGHPLAALL